MLSFDEDGLDDTAQYGPQHSTPVKSETRKCREASNTNNPKSKLTLAQDNCRDHPSSLNYPQHGRIRHYSTSLSLPRQKCSHVVQHFIPEDSMDLSRIPQCETGQRRTSHCNDCSCTSSHCDASETLAKEQRLSFPSVSKPRMTAASCDGDATLQNHLCVTHRKEPVLRKQQQQQQQYTASICKCNHQNGTVTPSPNSCQHLQSSNGSAHRSEGRCCSPEAKGPTIRVSDASLSALSSDCFSPACRKSSCTSSGCLCRNATAVSKSGYHSPFSPTSGNHSCTSACYRGQKSRPHSLPRTKCSSVNMCNHSTELGGPSTSIADMAKGPAIFLDNDIIRKQREEIQLLMEELSGRDQELTDLVSSHQKQVRAWEADRDKLDNLQARLSTYEEELKRKERELSDTLAEMGRVQEQKELDLAELGKTRADMLKLAERISQNSDYIKEIEIQNKSLTTSVKELLAEKRQLEEREKELTKLLKEASSKSVQQQDSMKHMVEKHEHLQSQLKTVEEKCQRKVHENEAWRTRFLMEKDEAEKLAAECDSKDLSMTKMAQQLQESLQQAVALQKALFTSCEREKCKEEVLNSLRKQHKRTMQELANIRELYDLQNRDISTYHLSVKDVEKSDQETKREKSSSFSSKDEFLELADSIVRDRRGGQHTSQDNHGKLDSSNSLSHELSESRTTDCADLSPMDTCQSRVETVGGRDCDCCRQQYQQQKGTITQHQEVQSIPSRAQSHVSPTHRFLVKTPAAPSSECTGTGKDVQDRTPRGSNTSRVSGIAATQAKPGYIPTPYPRPDSHPASKSPTRHADQSQQPLTCRSHHPSQIQTSGAGALACDQCAQEGQQLLDQADKQIHKHNHCHTERSCHSGSPRQSKKLSHCRSQSPDLSNRRPLCPSPERSQHGGDQALSKSKQLAQIESKQQIFCQTLDEQTWSCSQPQPHQTSDLSHYSTASAASHHSHSNTLVDAKFVRDISSSMYQTVSTPAHNTAQQQQRQTRPQAPTSQRTTGSPDRRPLEGGTSPRKRLDMHKDEKRSLVSHSSDRSPQKAGVKLSHEVLRVKSPDSRLKDLAHQGKTCGKKKTEPVLEINRCSSNISRTILEQNQRDSSESKCLEQPRERQSLSSQESLGNIIAKQADSHMTAEKYAVSRTAGYHSPKRTKPHEQAREATGRLKQEAAPHQGSESKRELVRQGSYVVAKDETSHTKESVEGLSKNSGRDLDLQESERFDTHESHARRSLEQLVADRGEAKEEDRKKMTGIGTEERSRKIDIEEEVLKKIDEEISERKRWKMAGEENRGKVITRGEGPQAPGNCPSTSDLSNFPSPSKFDDELTPADSDGMCRELKREIKKKGGSNGKSSSRKKEQTGEETSTISNKTPHTPSGTERSLDKSMSSEGRNSREGATYTNDSNSRCNTRQSHASTLEDSIRSKKSRDRLSSNDNFAKRDEVGQSSKEINTRGSGDDRLSSYKKRKGRLPPAENEVDVTTSVSDRSSRRRGATSPGEEPKSHHRDSSRDKSARHKRRSESKSKSPIRTSHVESLGERQESRAGGVVAETSKPLEDWDQHPCVSPKSDNVKSRDHKTEPAGAMSGAGGARLTGATAALYTSGLNFPSPDGYGSRHLQETPGFHSTKITGLRMSMGSSAMYRTSPSKSMGGSYGNSSDARHLPSSGSGLGTTTVSSYSSRRFMPSDVGCYLTGRLNSWYRSGTSCSRNYALNNNNDIEESERGSEEGEDNEAGNDMEDMSLSTRYSGSHLLNKNNNNVNVIESANVNLPTSKDSVPECEEQEHADSNHNNNNGAHQFFNVEENIEETSYALQSLSSAAMEQACEDSESRVVADDPDTAPVAQPVEGANLQRPFTTRRQPSLYRQLAQIHFCEKTRRYEWVSVPPHLNQPQQSLETRDVDSLGEGRYSESGDISSSDHTPTKARDLSLTPTSNAVKVSGPVLRQVKVEHDNSGQKLDSCKFSTSSLDEIGTTEYLNVNQRESCPTAAQNQSDSGLASMRLGEGPYICIHSHSRFMQPFPSGTSDTCSRLRSAPAMSCGCDDCAGKISPQPVCVSSVAAGRNHDAAEVRTPGMVHDKHSAGKEEVYRNTNTIDNDSSELSSNSQQGITLDSFMGVWPTKDVRAASAAVRVACSPHQKKPALALTRDDMSGLEEVVKRLEFEDTTLEENSSLGQLRLNDSGGDGMVDDEIPHKHESNDHHADIESVFIELKNSNSSLDSSISSDVPVKDGKFRGRTVDAYIVSTSSSRGQNEYPVSPGEIITMGMPSLRPLPLDNSPDNLNEDIEEKGLAALSEYFKDISSLLVESDSDTNGQGQDDARNGNHSIMANVQRPTREHQQYLPNIIENEQFINNFMGFDSLQYENQTEPGDLYFKTGQSQKESVSCGHVEPFSAVKRDSGYFELHKAEQPDVQSVCSKINHDHNKVARPSSGPGLRDLDQGRNCADDAREEVAVPFEEKLSAFLEVLETPRTDSSRELGIPPPSPATKLHRLLLESQHLVWALEQTSAVPESLRSSLTHF